MSSLISLLIVSALAAAGGPAPPPAEQPPSSGPASLTFVSKDAVLVGTVYGIDAIDAQPRAYGQRVSADVLAGHRTVWYSCPNASPMSDGSRISFDFVAGQRYELVCQAAKGAVIRPVEGC